MRPLAVEIARRDLDDDRGGSSRRDAAPAYAAFTSYAARSVAPPPYPHAPPLQAYAYGGPFSGGAGAGAAYGYGYGNPACGGYSHRDAGAAPRVGGGGGVKRSRYDDAQRGSDDTLCLRRLPEWVGEDSLAGLVSNLPGYRHLKLLPTNGTKTLFVLFESASLAAAGLEALRGREVCGSGGQPHRVEVEIARRSLQLSPPRD